MFGCPHGAVGARKFGALCRPVPPDAAALDVPKEEFGDIEAWRPEASMPGCSVGWLAGLADWLGWLAGLAGWLQLAGYCLLATAAAHDSASLGQLRLQHEFMHAPHQSSIARCP